MVCKVRTIRGLQGTLMLKGRESSEARMTGEKQKKLLPLKQMDENISNIMVISTD